VGPPGHAKGSGTDHRSCGHHGKGHKGNNGGSGKGTDGGFVFVPLIATAGWSRRPNRLRGLPQGR
jgi:hypothetical protein